MVFLPSAKRTLSSGFTFSSLSADNALLSSLNASLALDGSAKPTFQPDFSIASPTWLPVTKPAPLFVVTGFVVTSTALAPVLGLPSTPKSDSLYHLLSSPFTTSTLPSGVVIVPRLPSLLVETTSPDFTETVTSRVPSAVVFPVTSIPFPPLKSTLLALRTWSEYPLSLVDTTNPKFCKSPTVAALLGLELLKSTRPDLPILFGTSAIGVAFSFGLPLAST